MQQQPVGSHYTKYSSQFSSVAEKAEATKGMANGNAEIADRED
jgi:hypothetical protein